MSRRKPLSVETSLHSYLQVVKCRVTLGYMAASGVVFGALFAFIGASEQIFSDTFDQGDKFALLFAGIAGSLAIANLLNARIVEKIGMRRISHIVLFVFVGLAVLNAILMTVVGEELVIFFPLFALTFACFGLLGANFSAIALEPQGENIGPASAAYGFFTTTFSFLFGWLIARQFDGSVIPILYGFVCLGLLSLLFVWITEKGELFEPASHRR